MIRFIDVQDKTVINLNKGETEKAITVLKKLTEAVCQELQRSFPEVGFDVSVDRQGQLTLWSNRATPGNIGARWRIEEYFLDLDGLVEYVNDVAKGDESFSD